MSRDPDLSVVVVNWNAGERLRACVRSLDPAAGERSIELIVVDNASRDGSLCGIEGSLARGRVRLVREEQNLGFARACNVGLETATGRHALLLNPDTRVAEGALDELCTWLDGHPDVGVVGCRLVDEAGEIERSFGRFPGLGEKIARAGAAVIGRPGQPDPEAVGVPVNVDWVTGAFLGIGRAALGEGLRLDGRYPLYFEDVDLCYRVWAAGLRVVHVPRAWAVHTRGGTAPGADRRRLRRLGESIYHRSRGGLTGWLLAVVYATLARAWRADASRLPREPDPG